MTRHGPQPTAIAASVFTQPRPQAVGEVHGKRTFVPQFDLVTGTLQNSGPFRDFYLADPSAHKLPRSNIPIDQHVNACRSRREIAKDYQEPSPFSQDGSEKPATSPPGGRSRLCYEAAGYSGIPALRRPEIKFVSFWFR